MRLAGQIAIVTGAGSGIGKLTVALFREHGAPAREAFAPKAIFILPIEPHGCPSPRTRLAAPQSGSGAAW